MRPVADADCLARHCALEAAGGRAQAAGEREGYSVEMWPKAAVEGFAGYEAWKKL